MPAGQHRSMSRARSSSASHAWPRYGYVPLTRCPACPREEPLVRLTCKKVETGNYGREFVKCESRPQAGRILKQCTHFMWMDAYIEKMQFEGLMGGANLIGESHPSSNLKVACTGEDGRNGGNGSLCAEWKEVNGTLKELLHWKKVEVAIAAAFYVCVMFSLMFIVLRN